MKTELITIYDKMNFHYEVDFDYYPHLGFVIAKYNGKIIESMETNKIIEPVSDNDVEWENYDACYSVWIDNIKSYLMPACANYFNHLINER